MQVATQKFIMSGRIRRFFVRPLLQLIVFACLLPGTAMLAQLAGKGAVSGNIQDSTGAVIPKAKITVTNTATGVSVTMNSTDAGDYTFPTLDPGDYTIKVEAQGFQIQQQQNVNVNALETTTYSPKLTIGSSSQTVTVSTAPPQLQTTNATLGSTLEGDMYSALPVEMGAFGSQDQRRATDFAYLLPGVQGNQTSGGTTTNSGLVNGVGARGGAIAIYVNGVPFTNISGEGDPRFVWSAISVDAVGQFQVQTSGYSAMYEGEGVQNYNVKQGGNAFHGSVYEFFRNTALDSWGFVKGNNPYTGLPQKPIEHQSEFGIDIGGPLLPFGSWREKLFYFGNYTGFRSSSTHPIIQSYPSVAEQQGNFQGIAPIYDPNTQGGCTAFYGYQCRYRYGYTHGAGQTSAQVVNGQPIDVIPTSEMSQVALALQAGLPNSQLINTNPTNNFVAPNLKGLNNYSTTHRIDFIASAKDVLTLTGAYGRQVSNSPVGSTSTTNNQGPQPYNYGQAYAPKTYVGVIEETHEFSPHVINQFNAGFARYASLDYNANQTPQYAATAYGYNGAPAGQAAGSFPNVKFSGVDAPTAFAGYNAVIGIANSYELLDNVQWTLGKHSLTLGGMISWLGYNYTSASGGSTPVTISNAVTETAGILSNGSLIGSTGAGYASFLLGQPDNVSFTQNLINSTHAQFRPMSPYIQDTWRVSDKLTLDLGLRYDFYPTYKEAHDQMSYFDPNLLNPVTGVGGALNFAGHGAGTCNCDTPVKNYFKNIGPRLGLAYQIDPQTVVRASYDVVYSHGNGVAGSSASAQGTKTLGFSASPNFSANSSTYLTTAPLDSGVPAYAPAAGIASGPQFGTGYTKTPGYTGSPSSATYGDPYYGGRAPQFINYTFGLQHQWTNAFTTSISYVGSQAHFLMSDGGNARGYWSDQLDPKYLNLGPCLTTAVSKLATTKNAAGVNCQTAVQQSGAAVPAWFNTSQQLSVALKPFPQYAVSDNYGQVSNAHYNGLQTVANLRVSRGVTIMTSYTWGRSIDDGGTFRTGYAIPAAYSNTGRSYAADAIERTVSVTNQAHHFVFTGVEHLPFGSGSFGGEHAWTRALFGGFEFSQIVQIYSGSPLAITATSCQTNPAQATCMPTLNPAFTGSARITKHWSGFGPNIAPSVGSATVAPTGPFISPTLANSAYMPAYTFGNAPRTAAYGLTGPGFFGMDISLRRSFPLHLSEKTKLNLQADLYNVTNFVQFGNIVTTLGSSNFGTPTTQNNNPRQAQLSARIEF
ncbi:MULTISPECIES: TonB-dependent receptor [Acidobacteriaceae]|uniref:TonB-dependent receptor n=1 Tax=Acidobacteriaceae TaxID=204434 RepID=UPI00131B57D2|nr:MULTISPECIES: TonB-dependent receptor [Acidobacteriaceae]MDW5267428.1 TonB-dependent receptor [Edaphobacter sp.]